MIEQTDKDISPEFIICASPGFYNDELRKEIEAHSFAKKIRFAVATNPGERGISEVLKRSELKEILKEERLRTESLLVDSLLKNIAKDEKFSYGINDVFNKAQLGAIDKLIVSENLIFSENPEENKTVMDIIEMVEQNSGKVSVIEQEEPLKVIESLGKIGAILRY
jgi:stalled ribosome rescue protein Dom34